MSKRIKDLKSFTIIDDETYMLVDSANEGTRKYRIKDMEQNIIQKVNELLNSNSDGNNNTNAPVDFSKDVVGIKNINSIKDVINNKIIVTITLTDGTSKSFDIYNGKDGIDGKDYILTESDKAEIVNEVISEIPAPKDGLDGKSAYQLAVEKGYTSTLEEWLESLKGTTPRKGIDYYTDAEKTELINDIINSLPMAESEEF